jgi:SAM-dependent methyltransferase
MLQAFRESGLVQGAIGIELSSEIVSASPFVSDDRFRLEVADVMAVGERQYEFDLVLLHDVLEHIPEYPEALAAVATSLARGGHVFVSFPPYFSSFGGHQQLAGGLARKLPFVHYLPARLFFRVAAPGEQEYMTAEGARQDMLSVRRTRLTLSAAESAFASVGLEVAERELFLVRPEHTVRYGLRARRVRALGRLPGLREVAVNGAFYLLRRG